MVLQFITDQSMHIQYRKYEMNLLIVQINSTASVTTNFSIQYTGLYYADKRYSVKAVATLTVHFFLQIEVVGFTLSIQQTA